MDVNVTNGNVVKNISNVSTRTYEKVLNKNNTYLAVKRGIDIIGAIVGILLLIPITIGIFIAKIILRDKGPIMYTHNRIGKDGKMFKMYKFRSMVEGADEILFKYLEENEEAREEYRINKKLKNDPRITPIGKFIRKTSLDEFPQFINVLKGDMSLVGPRPYLPREIEDMGEAYKTIIKCKPGVTGLWQIQGRNDVSFQDRIDLDLKYIEKRCTNLDCKILANTVLKVIEKEGAK